MFRLIPIYPADRHLLAIKWRDSIYFNACLPFRFHFTPKLFNILSNLVCWIAEQKGMSCIFHYLDGFLIIVPPHSSACKQNLSIFIQLCDNLGAPLMGFRKDRRTFDLNFLLAEHSHMEIKLPQDNIKIPRNSSTVATKEESY